MSGQVGSGEPAAPASADSRELVVPLAPPSLLHLCVEYPGYVGDEHKVLETLGGLEGIAGQLQACRRSASLLHNSLLH